MISLELAKKLKAAELVWEPQDGDLFYWDDGTPDMYDHRHFAVITMRDRTIFAPRLDRLLGEIEKRGYIWDLCIANGGGYWIELYREIEGSALRLCNDVKAYTPEEAAGQALLWILKKEAANRADSAHPKTL